jgi:hypothetical protein
MRWEENTRKCRYSLDLLHAGDIIDIAYDEGYINYNTYAKAMQKIK